LIPLIGDKKKQYPEGRNNKKKKRLPMQDVSALLSVRPWFILILFPMILTQILIQNFFWKQTST